MTQSPSDGPEQIRAWIDRALAAAGEHGCAVVVDETSEANLRWALNSLTTNGQMHSRSLTVHVFAAVEGGTATGTASGPLTFDTDVEALVERATASALAGEPSADAFALADASAGPPADGDAPAAATSIDTLAGFAAGLGEQLTAFAARGDELYGFAEHILTTTWLATSAGARRRHVQPSGRVEVNAKRPATGASVWTGRYTAEFTDVDPADLAAELTQRLEWSAGRIDLPPGRYETILPSGAVADLLIYAYWVSSAQDAAEGRTVWAARGSDRTRIGEQVAPSGFSMRSDPAAPGLEMAPFAIVHGSVAGEVSSFDNGAPVGAVDWIRDGRLTELIRSRRYAADHGADFAFPTSNLIVDAGGTASLDDLVASTERGLLLTCLWYIREVDPETLLLTGLTRDGVYLIENGKIVGAVNNFRFNESPVGLLSRIVEVGRSERCLCREWNDDFTHTQVPPVKFADFNMSTVSQAS